MQNDDSVNNEILDELLSPHQIVPPNLYFSSSAHLQSIFKLEFEESHCPIASPFNQSIYSKEDILKPCPLPKSVPNFEIQSTSPPPLPPKSSSNSDIQPKSPPLPSKVSSSSNIQTKSPPLPSKLSSSSDIQTKSPPLPSKISNIPNVQTTSSGNQEGQGSSEPITKQKYLGTTIEAFQPKYVNTNQSAMKYENLNQLESQNENTNQGVESKYRNEDQLLQTNPVKTEPNKPVADIPATLLKSGITICEGKTWSGCFGTVYKAEKANKDGSKILVALKIPSDMNRNNNDTFREYAVNKNLVHKFIIRLIEVIPEIQCLVLEFAELGSLSDFLIQRSEGVGWIRRITWAMQICEGVMYLHKSDLIHGDIRCKNVLLDSCLTAKIADFGQAIFTEKGYTKTPSQYIYNPVYTEVSKRKLQEKYQFSYWLDTSFFAILMGHLLFHGKDHDELSDFRSRLSDPFEGFLAFLPPWIDSNYKAIISSCFSAEIRSFDQIFLLLNITYRKVMENEKFFENSQDVSSILYELEKADVMDRRKLIQMISKCPSQNPFVAQALIKQILSFSMIGDVQAITWCLSYWIKYYEFEVLINKLFEMLQIAKKENQYDTICSILVSFGFLKDYLFNSSSKLDLIKSELAQLLNHSNAYVVQMAIHLVGELKLKDKSLVQTLKNLFQYPNFADQPFENHTGSVFFSGTLLKEGGMLKSWKKRKVELRHDKIAYYTPDSKLKGTIPAQKIDRVEMDFQGKKFLLKVYTKSYETVTSNNLSLIKKEQRIFLFDAESKENCQQWKEKVEKVFPFSPNDKLSERDLLEFTILLCFVKLELINEFIWRKLIRYLYLNNAFKFYTIQALGDIYIYFQKYHKISLPALDETLILLLIEPNYWKEAVQILKFRKSVKVDDTILNLPLMKQSSREQVHSFLDQIEHFNLDSSIICTIFSKPSTPPIECADVVAHHMNFNWLKKVIKKDFSALKVHLPQQPLLPFVAMYCLIKNESVEESKICDIISKSESLEELRYIFAALPCGVSAPHLIALLLGKTFPLEFEWIKKKLLHELIQSQVDFPHTAVIISDLSKKILEFEKNLQCYNLNFFETLEIEDVQDLLVLYFESLIKKTNYLHPLILKVLSKGFPIDQALDFDIKKNLDQFILVKETQAREASLEGAQKLNLQNFLKIDKFLGKLRQSQTQINEGEIAENILSEEEKIKTICNVLKGNNLLLIYKAQQQFSQLIKNPNDFVFKNQEYLNLILNTLCDLLAPFVDSNILKMQFADKLPIKKYYWAAGMFVVISERNPSIGIRHNRSVTTLYNCLLAPTFKANNEVQKLCLKALKRIDFLDSQSFALHNVLYLDYSSLLSDEDLQGKLYRALGIILVIQKLKERNNSKTLSILFSFAVHPKEEVQIYALRALGHQKVVPQDFLKLWDKIKAQSTQVQIAYVEGLGDLVIQELGSLSTHQNQITPLFDTLLSLMKTSKEPSILVAGLLKFADLPLHKSIAKALVDCTIVVLNNENLEVKLNSLITLRKWIVESNLVVDDPKNLANIISQSTKDIKEEEEHKKEIEQLTLRITHILYSNAQ